MGNIKGKRGRDLASYMTSSHEDCTVEAPGVSKDLEVRAGSLQAGSWPLTSGTGIPGTRNDGDAFSGSLEDFLILTPNLFGTHAHKDGREKPAF